MITCPECTHENSEDTRFCVKCGDALPEPQQSAAAGVDDEVATHEEPRVVASPSRTSPLQTEATTQDVSKRDFVLLVVDDIVDNLVLLSLFLQQAGYRVVTASNGEEAYRVASVTQPDLILMDIGMPELDGLGATRKIKDHPSLRGVPIIAVTAFNTDGFRRAAYDVGIDGYLTKPYDFDRLHELIRSLLPVR